MRFREINWWQNRAAAAGARGREVGPRPGICISMRPARWLGARRFRSSHQNLPLLVLAPVKSTSRAGGAARALSLCGEAERPAGSKERGRPAPLSGRPGAGGRVTMSPARCTRIPRRSARWGAGRPRRAQTVQNPFVSSYGNALFHLLKVVRSFHCCCSPLPDCPGETVLRGGC